MTFFSSFELRNWRQFSRVELNLGDQVTIITGSNGCGKTTILSLLSQHFGWQIPLASTPYVSKRSAKRLYKDVKEKPVSDAGKNEEDDEANINVEIGRVTYEPSGECRLHVPRFVSANYNVSFSGRVDRRGLFIPSHRQQSVYNPVNQIPTNPVSAAQIYEQFRSIAAQQYQNGGRTNKNPGAVQKEALISLAVFGEGNSTVTKNHEYQNVFQSFESRLRTILPEKIGFQRLKISMPEVVLETESGSFPLDAMSGGISSLFSIAWQIHMFDMDGGDFTVIIDEPENHLHPSMQRSFLPSLAAAFPNARFIVATHSPFVVSSFQSSRVYMLDHNSEGQVVSEELSEKNFSGSANTILKQVLGVESTIPIWVEEIINTRLSQIQGDDPKTRAEEIMSGLRALGIVETLGDFVKK